MVSDAFRSELGSKIHLDYKKTTIWVVSCVTCLLPLIWIDLTTYLVLTVAGVAMGMLLFLTAAGLTLIFGLLDVLNLAHGAFFVWGAYVSYTLLNILDSLGWVETGTLVQSFGSLIMVFLFALLVGSLLGIVFERVIIRKVYGDHLKQILITMGASLVMVEIIKIVWGPNDDVVLIPRAFQGSLDILDVVVVKFRLVCIIVGSLVLTAINMGMKKTKLGLIIRAGVENQEIVQIRGYNIKRIFMAVFAAGAGLSAAGGAMWCIFKKQVHPGMGGEILVFALIVVTIGGMGSVSGSLLGALIVGLAFNYVAFLLPKLALGINILIMAIILLIRPKGLLGQF